MKALYHRSNIISKLKEAISEIFTNETEPTRRHLTNLMMSVIALNGFQSEYSHSQCGLLWHYGWRLLGSAAK